MEYKESNNTELFQIDPELENEEPTWQDKLRQAIIWVTAVAVVLGLLYLSGIYQALLLRRTPSAVQQDSIESVLDAEKFLLPVRAFVFQGESDMSSFRTEENVRELVRKSEAIWNQADIELTLTGVTFVSIDEDQAREFLTDPISVMNHIADFREPVINIFLVSNLQGINGVSFGGINSVVVADFTSVHDFRTLAHEIGHVLGLSHVKNRSHLMSSGANGEKLSIEEIMSTRESVGERFCEGIC